MDGPNGPRHISRALICSGYTISKVAGEKGQYWDVVKTTKVDTTSPEYLAAKCDDTSEEEWNRVVVLVGYTPLQESVSCGLGTDEVNQESCRRINQEGGARASPTATPRPTSLNKSDLFASSENIACYDNPATPEKETRDLGVHDGYWDGAKIPIRICAVSGFKSTGQESNDGYGVKGGGGDLVVNSRVSQNVYSMFIDAKNSGLILRAISGFRTMSHSEDLCPCDGTMISKPGYSNHQMGISIDFAGLIPKNRAAKVCETDRAKDLGQPTWEWLEKNAQKYGYRQLMYESWHWDPIPVASRCGGDGGG